RDITGRMEDFLSRHGFRVAVMKADAVPPERREAWVAKRVEEGVDVLVCHPRLVQTGLDLVEFPTIAWYETDYSVYTMRQASRRSWRIGQSEPVQVVFMAYRSTLQADALKLVAQKLQSSLAVEGELPEDGLAAYGDDGDDLLIALARKIVAGEEDAGSVESVFEQARQVAAEAEALLVDEGWHAPEPEPVAVEPETVTVLGKADERHEEAREPQRTLFSWAEFMAGEPDDPPKRRGRDEAPTLSLFEWALEQEQEGALAA
ncbi:MAG: helicase C-terminal domain-containing protein, partial [Chloroflexi bacterium]|nr:helicase C-terminal domain-containing protein [Chloroflexota bacterium]